MLQAMPGQHLLFNASRGACAVCGKEGLPCARCRLDYYCGKPHQKQDWPRHKAGCGVLELHTDPRLGRYLVATKDIPANTVIMREQPLVGLASIIDAKGAVATKVACVGCYRILDPAAGSTQQCSQCGWPVCSVACSRSPDHRAECAAYQRAHFKLKKSELTDFSVHWNVCARALRICLAWQEQPRILELQSAMTPPSQEDIDEMGEAQAHKMAGIRVISKEDLAWFRDTTGISWVSMEDLERASYILQINQMDVTGQDGYGPCGLFAGLSMVEHSCMPNTVWGRVALDSLQLQLLTCRDVKRGDHLTRDYRRRHECRTLAINFFPFQNPFEERCSRREQLMYRGLGFLCRCELCADPTERGLHLSAWCCQNCTVKSIVSVTDQGVWQCPRCRSFGTDWSYRATLQADLMVMKLLSGDTKLKAVESFLRRHQWPAGPLHSTNGLVLQAKLVLALGINSTVLVGIITLPHEVEATRARREVYLEDVLKALDVIRPGINNQRATIKSALFFKRMAEISKLTKTASPPQIVPRLEELFRLVDELEVLAFYPQAKIQFNDCIKKPIEGLAKAVGWVGGRT